MVRGVVALLHPRINIVATFNLPLVDVRHMTKGFQLLGDPEGPVAVAAGVADENIDHERCLVRPDQLVIMVRRRVVRKKSRQPQAATKYRLLRDFSAMQN